MQRRDLIALTGALFVVMLVAGFLIGGDTPDGDAAGIKVIAYYKDNDTQNAIAIVVIALSTIPLLLFASTFSARVRAALPARSVIPNFVLVTGTLFAAGLFAAGAIHVALTDLGDEIRPAAAQALNALDNDTWLAFVGPAALFVLGGSIAAIQSAALPTWLGWVGVVLFISAATPLGFVSGLLMLVWIIVVSVVLYLRGEPQADATEKPAVAAPG